MSDVFDYCQCRLPIAVNLGQKLRRVFPALHKYQGPDVASGGARLEDGDSSDLGMTDGLEDLAQVVTSGKHYCLLIGYREVKAECECAVDNGDALTFRVIRGPFREYSAASQRA